MASTGRSSMSYEVERAMRTIFKRCVQCPGTQPSCPSCKPAEICSLVPQDCNTCAHMTCIKDPSAAPSSPGPNVGAIAGGVIGGVAVVAVVVFFIWRFWIKKRREQQDLDAEEWEEEEEGTEQKSGPEQHRFTAMHTDAVSTRTRGSLANSILSRASNIIQIAYIPGVTNRNGSGHDSMHAPVPPVPAARGQPPKSPLSNEGDALFFRPGDLRDSTWSGTSSLRSGNRDTQYTRQSITPSLARSSMASDVYRDDGSDVPMPAQTIMRAAPRMVSVKSTSSGSPSEASGYKSPVDPAEHARFAANTPPSGNSSKPGLQVLMPSQPARPSTSSSLGSQTSQYAKPKQITVNNGGSSSNSSSGKNLTGGARPFTSHQPSDSSLTPTTTSRHAPAISSPLADIPASPISSHSPEQSSTDPTPPLIQPLESPFYDASEQPPSLSTSARPSAPSVNPYATMGSAILAAAAEEQPPRPTLRGGGAVRGVNALSDIIEEATRRASRVPEHEGLGGRGEGKEHWQGPFDDRNGY
ncbi:hypothetical protein B0A50_02366 [Salinomyces thailandicus]|uniref:Membrane anchor Opy2 N-terminal domain-containing protein n=1 Tax=Salinomyces thailandicus TaxID=706561 RepID=A0A4U0U889_9PEZI|nr:hypothetical protein B0A50_02366 [Salinomyces thailandica]